MNADSIILSVVIPCFNDGKFLMEAVQSAESNRRGRHEIIIVNDGSNDPATLDVLAAVGQRGHRVLHQENRGLGAARNQGIKFAKGRYILPLDSDNRIRSDYMDRGIEILDRDPIVDVVYGDAEYFGDKNGRNFVPEFNLARLLVWNYIDACAVFRKNAWERCGGYDEGMPHQGFEDWDLWCRIACSGGGFHHIPEILFDYRMRKDSMSSVMIEPVRRAAILDYIKAKRIEVSVGEFTDAYQSWDPVLDQVRQRPLRTFVRLFLKRFFPRLIRFKSRTQGRVSPPLD
jgi:glycosyltransferase involved in cell wall biosynthesis